MKKLKNKTAIITGSTSGIGEGTAKRFAKEGANLILSGRNQKAGERIFRELREEEDRSCYFVQGGITDFDTNQLHGSPEAPLLWTADRCCYKQVKMDFFTFCIISCIFGILPLLAVE